MAENIYEDDFTAADKAAWIEFWQFAPLQKFPLAATFALTQVHVFIILVATLSIKAFVCIHR